MNRRGFFGVVGAAIAGAVVGPHVQPQADSGFKIAQSGTKATFKWVTSDNVGLVSLGDLTMPAEPIRRIDGKPINPGQLYFDGNGVLQLKPDSEMPSGIDFDYYDAWL